MSEPTDETTPTAGERADIPPPTEADREVNLSHAYHCSHLLPDPGGEVCRGFIRRLVAAEADAARLRARVAELEEGLRDAYEEAARVADRYAADADPATKPAIHEQDRHDRYLGKLVSENIAYDIRRKGRLLTPEAPK